MIVILDNNMGNLGSHKNMMKKIGFHDIQISADAEVLMKAEKIVIPGVGAFDNAMDNLERLGIIPVLEEKVLKEKVPVLGICLGMQLFTRSSEEGSRKGLGWIDAKVVKFNMDENQHKLKIPHMGWNTIILQKRDVLFQGMEDKENRFYFVHSYHLICEDDRDVVAITNYGYNFPSVIRRDNIVGCQFHPEKSHKFGIQLYKNFIES